jgi:hypothetical protein
MQKWKIIAGLLLVFILGTLTGVLGTGLILKRHHLFFSDRPEGRKAFIMERLTHKLDLSEEQRVRVEAIIDRVQSETFHRISEGRRFVREQLEKGFAEIRKELTPEQQRRFDEMKAELERRRKERSKRFHGPWRPEDDI